MPNVVIFDDDSIKCDLAEAVTKAMARGWSLSYAKPVQSLKEFQAFVKALMSSAEKLLLLDIEIKEPSKGEDWRPAAAKAVPTWIPVDAKNAFRAEVKRLKGHYGTDRDYQLSLALLAYARLIGVPVITISTKPNSNPSNPSHNIQCATSAGVPLLGDWSESWRTWLRPSGRIKSLAKQIRGEWLKHKGAIRQRLWPTEALKEAWFSSKVAGQPVIPHPWTNDLATRQTYRAKLNQYLSAVSGLQVSSFSLKRQLGMDVLERRHESLKRIVGTDAKAHSGTGYPSELNTVAILAAAWDPNSKSWFPVFDWASSCQLMTNSASKQELVDVVLAIGGEDGLFAHLLRNKPEVRKSTLKKIEANKNQLKLTLNFDLSRDSRGGKEGVMQKFATLKKAPRASTPKSLRGDTLRRLYEAWSMLCVKNKRMIDIEVTNHEIIFKSLS